MKRLILLVLILTLTATAFSEASGAGESDNQRIQWTTEEGVTLIFEQIDATSCAFVETDGSPVHLIIPSEVEGLSVTNIGNGACFDIDGLQTVVVPEGVTEIGLQAFSCCYALWEITLPSTLRTVGRAAFQYDRSLCRLVFPSGMEELGEELVSSCENLMQVVLPASLHSSIQLSDSPRAILYDTDESIPPLGIGEENGFIYAVLDGKAILIHNLNSGNIKAPARLGGCPLTAIGASAFNGHSYEGTILVSISIPDSVDTLDDGWIENLHMCHDGLRVFLPASVSKLGYLYGSSSNLTVYAPENSAAYDWALQNASAAIPCDDDAELSAPRSYDEMKKLINGANTLDERLTLCRTIADSFSDELAADESWAELFVAQSDLPAGLLPADWQDASDDAVCAMPEALRGKPTLILYDDGAPELACAYMASLPESLAAKSLEDAECVVVIREYKKDSGYTYMPPANSRHRIYEAYAYPASDASNPVLIYRKVSSAKQSGNRNELDGERIGYQVLWNDLFDVLQVDSNP